MAFASDINARYNLKVEQLKDDQKEKIQSAVQECKRRFEQLIQFPTDANMDCINKTGAFCITMKKGDVNNPYFMLNEGLKQALLEEGMIVTEPQKHTEDCPIITTTNDEKRQCECDWEVRIPMVSCACFSYKENSAFCF